MEKLSDVPKYKSAIAVCGEHCEILESISKLHGAQQPRRIWNLREKYYSGSHSEFSSEDAGVDCVRKFSMKVSEGLGFLNETYSSALCVKLLNETYSSALCVELLNDKYSSASCSQLSNSKTYCTICSEFSKILQLHLKHYKYIKDQFLYCDTYLY